MLPSSECVTVAVDYPVLFLSRPGLKSMLMTCACTLQGGYSSHMVVNQDFVLNVPDNISLAGAAPLMCAGITVCFQELTLYNLLHECRYAIKTLHVASISSLSGAYHDAAHSSSSRGFVSPTSLTPADNSAQVYSPLRHYGLDKKGMKLGVVGLGGLGHMCAPAA
jgi:hypothetical protein